MIPSDGGSTAAFRATDRLLVIDTALQCAVVVLGTADGTVIDEVTWVAGHRHGEELLPRLEALLAANATALSAIRGVVCGTGPGAFTGLRVGIATAKALAHSLDVPIAGVSTASALLAGVAGETRRALLLPAGPSDRVLVEGGEARLLRAGSEPAVPDEDLIAIDLPGRAPAVALARGEGAVEALGASLLRLGGERLLLGDFDDLARLVPEYVTLPRGVTEERGEVAWSRGRG